MRKISKILYIIVFVCFFTLSTAYAQTNYEIMIRGIQGDLLNNVNSRIAVETANLNHNLNGDEATALKARLPNIIQEAMAPFGYFQPAFKTHLQRSANKWIIIVDIKK